MTQIHPTSIVEEGAQIGDEVQIGPFAYVQAGASIGNRCVLGPHVVVMRHASVGPNCRLHAGAVIGDLPQDLAFGGGESYVRIGANCVLREGVTVHRGTKPGTETVMGDNCFLMANSHLAHNVRLGQGVIIANGALLAGYAEVGDRVFVSGNCAIHQFVRVGRLAMLGGGSMVSMDVPPFCTMHPVTYNSVAAINTVGLKRAGVTPEERMVIKRAFRLLYRSGFSIPQALDAIRGSLCGADGADEQGPGRFALELCRFVESSKRGICGAAGKGEE